MNRKWIALASTWIAALLLVVGCSGGKQPEPAPIVEEPEPVVAPVVVKPPPAPPVMDDEKPLWDEDVEAFNDATRDPSHALYGLIGDVYFEFDKYELKPEARERLAKNARFMREHPRKVFRLEGHCDERGTNEYNLALGERRANAARSYLLSLGVPAAQMRTISYGEERPTCMTHAESCWSQNRRAAFYLASELG
ncbi:MAG: peptidoglycan-associated lipoprotein Pal [Acidobacteriota bacterium]|nr:peptidoglycan-associated lipoprotein Pal [Acidobacteriota bacterium]